MNRTTGQLSMTAYDLWAAGYEPTCVVTGRGACRFAPCTVAQDVRCCRECMACGSPCKKAKVRA